MKLTLGNQEIEITEEQRQTIAEALNLKAPDEVDNWPTEDSEYWYVNAQGSEVKDTWDDHPTDKKRLAIGTAFKTKEEAQAHVRYLKALTRVKGSSSFKPNWDDREQQKYCVYYEHTPASLEITICWTSNHIGVPVYYESEEDAQQAIKDHKEDFLILAGVK